MEGVTVIRTIRMVQIVQLNGINNRPNAAPLLPVPRQQALPPPPPKNNRCLNAFILLIIYTVGIGSIVLGAVHINDCQAEKMLPTSLVVFGGLLIVARLINCVYDCRSVCEEDNTEDIPPCLLLLNVMFLLAEFGMFLTLCVYTFRVDPTTKPEDHLLKNYCDDTLYKTTFYGCIVGLIFYGLPLLCGCCKACCSK